MCIWTCPVTEWQQLTESWNSGVLAAAVYLMNQERKELAGTGKAVDTTLTGFLLMTILDFNCQHTTRGNEARVLAHFFLFICLLAWLPLCLTLSNLLHFGNGITWFPNMTYLHIRWGYIEWRRCVSFAPSGWRRNVLAGFRWVSSEGCPLQPSKALHSGARVLKNYFIFLECLLQMTIHRWDF